MFLTSTDLGDLTVILPRNNAVSWKSASSTLFYIGNVGELPIASLKMVYGDDVSDETLEGYNLLVFGRSSTLPFLSKVNDSLPAPFRDGSDEAIQPSMFVNYSLLPDTSVGYLQVLSSPFNPDLVILAVLGNTDLGIPMAGATLSQELLVSQLAGNFSIVYQDQIVSTDTRLGISKQGIVSELPVAVTVTPAAAVTDPSIPESPVVIQERPAWILPAMIVTSSVLVLALVVIASRGLLGRRSEKMKNKAEEGLTENDQDDKTH